MPRTTIPTGIPKDIREWLNFQVTMNGWKKKDVDDFVRKNYPEGKISSMKKSSSSSSMSSSSSKGSKLEAQKSFGERSKKAAMLMKTQGLSRKEAWAKC